MSKFVVINWNRDELIGSGDTIDRAVNSALDNSETFCEFVDDVEAEQVGVYEEVDGYLSIGAVTFKKAKK